MRGISGLAAKPVSFSRRTLLHGVRQSVNVMKSIITLAKIGQTASIVSSVEGTDRLLNNKM
jgi:hypothetical protein